MSLTLTLLISRQKNGTSDKSVSAKSEPVGMYMSEFGRARCNRAHRGFRKVAIARRAARRCCQVDADDLIIKAAAKIHGQVGIVRSSLQHNNIKWDDGSRNFSSIFGAMILISRLSCVIYSFLDSF